MVVETAPAPAPSQDLSVVAELLSKLIPAVFCQPQWRTGARYAVVTGTTPILVTDRPAFLLGIILDAGGAGDVRLFLYDVKTSSVPPSALQRLPGARTSGYEGFVNFPVIVNEGILARLSNADTNTVAWILYIER